jgi:hypothetical protein
MRKLILILTLACSPALHAASLQYDFSYTFNDGEQLYGSLMGTLLGDGDTIQVDAVTDLHYTAPLRNDCCLPDFSYDTLAPWSGSGTVSVSGATMDFQSTAPWFNEDYWGFGPNVPISVTAAIFDAYFDITCLEFCGEFIQAESFNSTNWQIVAVPVPPAFLLFGTGLGLLGWLRRTARRVR